MSYVYTLRYELDDVPIKWSFVSEENFTNAYKTACTTIKENNPDAKLFMQSLSRREGDEVGDEEPEYER